MGVGRTGRIVASALSLLLPGAGQLYVGATRRGVVLLAAAALALVSFAALAAAGPLDTIDRTLLAALLGTNLVVLALRLFAVLDVWRGGVAGVAVLVALTAAPHVAAGWVAFRSYDVLESVFAEAEPADVQRGRGLFVRELAVDYRLVDPWVFALEEAAPGEARPLQRSPAVLASAQAAQTKPWTTILLLGTDEGPGNFGARADTIILAAVQHGTGRAAAFGIPRNLVQVPLGKRQRLSREPLNHLYGLNGGGARGASALKVAVSNLLGIRVDYFALVNLLGFADVVDALGGVEILVKERLRDEVTRPAWGEPKPRIDVQPGRVYRFYGREALAYVRSRKDSSDYTRMARQRCFLSALADQLDPVQVLRHFGSLTRTIEANVHTDIPLDRLPSLVRLVTSVEPERTLTVTFGFDYFFGRQKSGNYPAPNQSRIRATVRNALLQPQLLTTTGKAKTARQSC